VDTGTFVEEFIAGWSQPKPEGFIDYFRQRSHPDVIAKAPLAADQHGVDAYMEGFRSLFVLMPDFTAVVQASSTTGDDVFIESHVTATLGGRRLSFDVVDHFVLRDGLIYRRTAYFDPAPIIIGILLRPWLIPKALAATRSKKR
jgi:ketosteroid isomerase-like protein